MRGGGEGREPNKTTASQWQSSRSRDGGDTQKLSLLFFYSFNHLFIYLLFVSSVKRRWCGAVRCGGPSIINRENALKLSQSQKQPKKKEKKKRTEEKEEEEEGGNGHGRRRCHSSLSSNLAWLDLPAASKSFIHH